jgi:glycosyltransferase involved in cell wall biosynthesis
LSSQIDAIMNSIENKKISVIIPCYNEQEVLPELFRRVTEAAKSWGLSWEAICVDDGSNDTTLVSAGMFYATGDAVIVIDADLQDPPEEMHRFIEKWKEGYDIVYAIRQHRKEGFLKKISYWMFYRIMSKMIDFELPLDSGDFCIMDRKIVDILNSLPERNRFVRGLRAWSGFKQTGLVYERHARAAGEAKYNFKRLRRLALDGIVSFSTVPLALAAHIGLWISVLAFLGIIFTVCQRLFESFFDSMGMGISTSGIPTIIISVLFLGGIQLIFLGVLGQYLGRIYDEVKQRPQWIIKQKLGILPNSKPPVHSKGL